MCPRQGLVALHENGVFPSSFLRAQHKAPIVDRTIREAKRGSPSGNTGHLIYLLWIQNEGWFTEPAKRVGGSLILATRRGEIKESHWAAKPLH